MHPDVHTFIDNLKNWQEEAALLREILLDCNLTEDFKWRNPCYTYQESNIAMIGAFKEYCALSFFKGVLLKDAEKLLHSPGENSQSVKLFKFTSTQEITERAPTIKAYLKEAIKIEKSGVKVKKKSTTLEFCVELEEVFNKDYNFKNAFEALTPGRQRGYNIFFTGAKQAATRKTRIEKYKARILDGFGINDCVCGLSKRMPGCDGSHNNMK